jgi:uncharacterized membrane protein
MSQGNTGEKGRNRLSHDGGSHDTMSKPSTELIKRPSASEFNTAMVHFYRAEVGKAVEWRSRLDTTTNWAVVTTGAAITFALGDQDPERHVVILLVSILVTFFLLFEARRYRYYDIWETRVHVVEREFYGPLLDPDNSPSDPSWQKSLAANLCSPSYHISYAEALGWRLRRNYIWIYLTHLLIWFVKIAIHPTPIDTLEEFFMRATVGPVSGQWMILIGVLFNGIMFILVLLTTCKRTASGEITH